jgi:ribonuclease D
MVPALHRRVAHRHVKTPAELATLVKRVAREPELAVDTEAASFHRFVDRIYLIQLSTRHETAVIDPLTVGEVSALGAVLSDPAIEVVFHDADYDLRLLDRDCSVRARRLFDTRVAAHLLGEPAVGLAALLEKHVGVRLDKKYQRADWSRRPLPREMLDYAALDTHYLLPLRDRLRADLLAKGRLAWAEEEFRRLESVRWTPPPANGNAAFRIKGARTLSRRGLAVLQGLWHWRDGVAAELDRASFRVLSNEALVAVADAAPRDLEVLKGIRGISERLLEQRGAAVIEAIQRGLDVPERDLPRFPRGERRVNDPAFERRVDRLKAVRNAAATRLGLDPGVLCPKGTLEAVARALPTSTASLGEIPELRIWQIDVLGEDFLKALQAQPSPR